MGESDNQGQPFFSLIVPAYNEEENIRRGVLKEITDSLVSHRYASELIVVDDGSKDATASLVEEYVSAYPFVMLVRNEHGGKAQAVRAGVMRARGKHVIFMDMDLSTTVTSIDACLEELARGYQVVIASRYTRGALREGEPLLRRVAGRVFSLIVRTLVLPDISDSQCGFKGFRREVARDLFDQMRVFAKEGKQARGPRVTAFDVELLLLARKRGYAIKEIPVAWRHVETRRVHLLPESLGMLWEVLQVYFSNLRGRYNH